LRPRLGASFFFALLFVLTPHLHSSALVPPPFACPARVHDRQTSGVPRPRRSRFFGGVCGAAKRFSPCQFFRGTAASRGVHSATNHRHAKCMKQASALAALGVWCGWAGSAKGSVDGRLRRAGLSAPRLRADDLLHAGHHSCVLLRLSNTSRVRFATDPLFSSYFPVCSHLCCLPHPSASAPPVSLATSQPIADTSSGLLGSVTLTRRHFHHGVD
jgi:hypothetical protein